MNAHTEVAYPSADGERVTPRVPPHSIEAEQSLLGGLLLDNLAWDRAADLLSESDFYRFEHRQIYAAISSLVGAGKPADAVTVHEHLQSLGRAGDCGGPAYLNALTQSVPSAANIRRYAEIVHEHALARRLIAAVGEAGTIAWGSGVPRGKLDRIAVLISTLERGLERRQAALLADLVGPALDRYTALAEGKEAPGISTGIESLDPLLNGGLHRGKMYVLAARPGVGKSSLSRSIGLHAAKLGRRVLLLSQEMPREEIADCVIAELGGINGQHLQTGRLEREEWTRLAEAADAAAKLPLHVEDQGGLTLADIRIKARAIKGVELVVLDYLQLSRSTLKNATTNDQIAEISKGLKALAMELGIPIIVLSQLNRDVEKRQDREPQLSDLRDSGAIEQDLDVAVLLWTVTKLNGDGRRVVGCKVAKHRGGPEGRFGLEFDAPRYRWRETTASIDPPSKPSRGGDL